MLTFIIEYRHSKSSPWLRSAMNWTVADLGFINHAAGYEKYRTRLVES